MKFGRNVLKVNTYRQTESDFRFDVTFKMAAITSLHARKCCHLVSENEASASTYAAASVMLLYLLTNAQNQVSRHWARLLLGWVTVCWRVNHLGL